VQTLHRVLASFFLLEG